MRLLPLKSFLFIISIAICCSVACAEKSISVNDLSSNVIGKKIRVDCEVHYGVDDSVKEALSNGIEMSFLLEVELRQQNHYWLDPLVNNLSREFRVKYHALSKQYVMIEMGSLKERSFPDLYSAFYYQRKIHNAEIASIKSLDVEQDYYFRARARLLSEKLPLPLRIKSYVSSSWRPSSGWTIWPM